MDRLGRIREKLAKGELCVGVHCWTTDLDFYEMCGMMGFDYVWIDNEHGGLSIQNIKNALIATNGGGAAGFVRVAGHLVEDLKPVLEQGPDGIIVPQVNTAKEAADIISICRYPLKGTRGFGPLRAIDYGLTSLPDYLRDVEGNTLRILQCEHWQAVENLDEILEVEGIDVIICGPMDLSCSVGKHGQFFDPEVKALMEKIIEKCRRHSVPYGLSIGYGAMDLVRFWKEAGASFISVGAPQEHFRDLSLRVIDEINSF